MLKRTNKSRATDKQVKDCFIPLLVPDVPRRGRKTESQLRAQIGLAAGRPNTALATMTKVHSGKLGREMRKDNI